MPGDASHTEELSVSGTHLTSTFGTSRSLGLFVNLKRLKVDADTFVCAPADIPLGLETLDVRTDVFGVHGHKVTRPPYLRSIRIELGGVQSDAGGATALFE
jgi:hypothetical protein